MKDGEICGDDGEAVADYRPSQYQSPVIDKLRNRRRQGSESPVLVCFANLDAVLMTALYSLTQILLQSLTRKYIT
jgi:hypothetical protein